MAEGQSFEQAPDPIAAAAVVLAEQLREALAARGSARLAIPGGSALAAVPAAREIMGGDWTRVDLTWVDERCVPQSDPESNRGAALRAGVFEAPAPRRIVPLFTDGESPRKAVLRAQGALEAQLGGGLDVLLLGLGEDGHIASLFPGREWPEDGLVARVRDSPKPPANRITLTVGMLATAQASVLVAVGEGKRDALARLRAGDPALPASGLAGLHVVTDQPIDDPAPTEERSG